MDAVVEDALVEWYETERLARAAGAQARRSEIIDFDAIRLRQNPALARLFAVIEDTVAKMSLLQPAKASDRQDNSPQGAKLDARVHA